MTTKNKKKTQAKSNQTTVATSYSLIRSSLSLIIKYYKTYLLFIVVYALTLAIFAQLPAQVNVENIKDNIEILYPGKSDNSAILAGVIVGETINSSPAGTILSTVLVLIFSLAFIYLLRVMHDGGKPRIKDGFYKGMYGLIPVILLILLIMLQLIPAGVSGVFYSISTLRSVTLTGFEQVFITGLFVAVLAATFYFITPTILATYIATLPNMTPLRAWRTAKNLVRRRRVKVMGRLLVGAILYSLIIALFLLLIVAIYPPAAVWYWWLISIAALPIGHTYVYLLYRSLA